MIVEARTGTRSHVNRNTKETRGERGLERRCGYRWGERKKGTSGRSGGRAHGYRVWVNQRRATLIIVIKVLGLKRRTTREREPSVCERLEPSWVYAAKARKVVSPPFLAWPIHTFFFLQDIFYRGTCNKLTFHVLQKILCLIDRGVEKFQRYFFSQPTNQPTNKNYKRKRKKNSSIKSERIFLRRMIQRRSEFQVISRKKYRVLILQRQRDTLLLALPSTLRNIFHGTKYK